MLWWPIIYKSGKVYRFTKRTLGGHVMGECGYWNFTLKQCSINTSFQLTKSNKEESYEKENCVLSQFL